MKAQKKSDTKTAEKPIFAIRLDQIMKLRGLRNKDLARLVYVEETTISGYRSGRRSPDPERMRQLCIAIPVSANYLLGITDNPSI